MLWGCHAFWKVLENELGPGKSWNLLGSDADGGRKCVHNCKRFSNSFFAISAQHVTAMNVYSSMDAAVMPYICLVTTVTAAAAIFKHCWFRQGPGKCFWGPGIFCNRENGNPLRWPLNGSSINTILSVCSVHADVPAVVVSC